MRQMKTTFVTAAVCLLLSAASAQLQFLQSERIAAAASWPESEPNLGLALDANDNCYVTGFFDGANDFGGVTLTNQGVGGPDMFVAKYDHAGTLQWVSQAGGTTVNYGRAAGADTNGDLYVVGGYSGSARFGGASLPAGSGEEFFLAKYSGAGALQWVQASTGGADDNYGIGLAVDSTGNSYALAVMDRSGTSLAFGSITATANNGGTTFLILVKYDRNGSAQWAQLFDTTQETYGSKVAVDVDGNVYVRGLFESDVTVGGAHLSGSAAKNPFVAKFDGSGNLAWIRQPVGGISGEGGVAVDAAGAVYISGYFAGTLNFGGGTTLTSSAGSSAPFGDAFLAKYDSSGAIQWAKAAGGASGGLYWDIALDAQTNIYVAGILGSDAALAKYNPAGTLQWTESASGPSAHPVASGVAKCAVDQLGNCYLAGFYQGTARLGTSTLQPRETWNFFLAEFGQPQPPASAMLSVVVSPPGTGTVNPNYNGQRLQVGTSHKMTAKAAAGCKFIEWTGGTNSALATLAFVMEPGLAFTANFRDVTRPTLAVLSPKAKQTVASPAITATGKAQDNVGVTAVYYQLNANLWALAAGTTNWSTPSLSLNPGTNVIRACAFDAAGNASLTNSITFTYAVQYTGIYVGQTNDDPSGGGGFALFVDAKQQALLIGGDPYNDDDGNALYGSCSVGADGRGHSDVNGNGLSFTISTNGSAAVAVSADAGSGDYPWQWAITGYLVTSGPFLAVAGTYSVSVSGQAVQGILSPDGWFYSSSPHQNGGGRCQFLRYGQPATETALGHGASTLILNSSATITSTGSHGNFTMKRVDPLPLH